MRESLVLGAPMLGGKPAGYRKPTPLWPVVSTGPLGACRGRSRDTSRSAAPRVANADQLSFPPTRSTVSMKSRAASRSPSVLNATSRSGAAPSMCSKHQSAKRRPGSRSKPNCKRSRSMPSASCLSQPSCPPNPLTVGAPCWRCGRGCPPGRPRTPKGRPRSTAPRAISFSGGRASCGDGGGGASSGGGGASDGRAPATPPRGPRQRRARW